MTQSGSQSSCPNCTSPSNTASMFMRPSNAGALNELTDLQLTAARLLAFVRKLAGDGFEKIGARYEALETSLFVHHERELGRGALELVQRI